MSSKIHSKQETFDTVASHLIQQGKPAVEEEGPRAGTCNYRTENGLMCAIGCLIPDSEYDENLEGQSPVHYDMSKILERQGYGRNITLLCELQRLHDQAERTIITGNFSHIKSDLRKFASMYGLEYKMEMYK